MATHSSILDGKSYGQRSLKDYSLWGCKELDMTEQLTLSFKGDVAIVMCMNAIIMQNSWPSARHNVSNQYITVIILGL